MAILLRREWSAFGRPDSLDGAMSHYDRGADIAALNWPDPVSRSTTSERVVDVVP